MHRDKTVARILLILHVVHLAVARPAIVRQRSLDVDEDVTPALEKRVYPNTPQGVYPVPQMGKELSTTSGISPSRDDPPPESGTAQLHNGQPQTSGPSPSQDDTLPASGDPQSHNGPPAGSNDAQIHDAPSQLQPPSGSSHGGSVHGESETPPPHALETEAAGVLSKESKLDPKVVAIFVASGLVAVTTAAVIGGRKWYLATHKHKPQPDNGDGSVPTEPDDVVRRDVSTHPRLPKKPVSRALANLRNEDSRLLSVLTRSVLERLD